MEDGSPRWDIYALIVIVLECDMGVDEFLPVKNEDDARRAVREYLKEKDICPHILSLVRRSVLAPDINRLPTMYDVMEAIKVIQFKKDVRKKFIRP